MTSKFGILKEEWSGEDFAGNWTDNQGAARGKWRESEKDHFNGDMTSKLWGAISNLVFPRAGSRVESEARLP
jgi:hypothetical protein